MGTGGANGGPTSPAGAIGNAEPIPVGAEMWLSDDFGFALPVEIVTRDDLNGEHRRELRNMRISTFEPADFRPDNRYRIEDTPGPRGYAQLSTAENAVNTASTK